MSKTTRAGKAGKQLGESIVEMINLMYQDNTALHFLEALVCVITDEADRRQELKKD